MSIIQGDYNGAFTQSAPFFEQFSTKRGWTVVPAQIGSQAALFARERQLASFPRQPDSQWVGVVFAHGGFDSGGNGSLQWLPGQNIGESDFRPDLNTNRPVFNAVVTLSCHGGQSSSGTNGMVRALVRRYGAKYGWGPEGPTSLCLPLFKRDRTLGAISFDTGTLAVTNHSEAPAPKGSINNPAKK